ncbi:MAG TPA: DUF4159 domain-containing protein [Rhodothermales bacterium]
MPNSRMVFPILIGLLLLIVTPGSAASARPSDAPAAKAGDDLGFTFVRIRYNSGGNGGGWRRWREAWAFDYPRAERHLYEAIERTTGIYIEGPPIVLDLTDERIFEYPILYLCEPGYWDTNDEEVEMMKEYFARGGFMIIDDFHDGGGGTVGPEWNNFYENIKRVFPDREPIELTPDHPIWEIYYDVDPVAAVSTKWETGEVPWLGPDDDTYYGIFDDDGRMMVVIAYNQDLGDGWEWPEYDVADGSTVSFQMAINFIFWALTH